MPTWPVNLYGEGNRLTITDLRIQAADLLRSSYQFLDPFKFVVDTEMAGREHHPVQAPTNPRE